MPSFNTGCLANPPEVNQMLPIVVRRPVLAGGQPDVCAGVAHNGVQAIQADVCLLQDSSKEPSAKKAAKA